MPRASLCFILALSAAGAAADPVTLQLSSALVWPGSLTLRGELVSQDFRLAAACQAPALLPAAQAGPEKLLAGLSLPWLKLGPLSPAGVLREAANPLGFGAGSDVFVQRSGFLLDLSIPATQAGVLFMPIPRVLGVFYEPDGGEGQRLGCLAGIGSRDGVSVEGFASISEPPARDREEEWLQASSPFPGGKTLTTAARLMLGSPWCGVSATIGASSAERCPPGSFAHLHCAIRSTGRASTCSLPGPTPRTSLRRAGTVPMRVSSRLLSSSRAPAAARMCVFHAPSASSLSLRGSFGSTGTRLRYPSRGCSFRAKLCFFPARSTGPGRSIRTSTADRRRERAAPRRSSRGFRRSAWRPRHRSATPGGFRPDCRLKRSWTGRAPQRG